LEADLFLRESATQSLYYLVLEPSTTLRILVTNRSTYE
jgi:hypothetical protein